MNCAGGVAQGSQVKVTYYHRRPQKNNTSIERVFETVRKALPASLRYEVAVARYESRGFWPRIWNTIEAIFHQGDVNHITGDVHYLACFLRKRKTLLTIHDCVTLERLQGFRHWKVGSSHVALKSSFRSIGNLCLQ